MGPKLTHMRLKLTYMGLKLTYMGPKLQGVQALSGQSNFEILRVLVGQNQ